MAERPIFVPAPACPELVRSIPLNFEWHSGYAPVQKQKNIKALHAAAAEAGYAPTLEISSKSETKLGRHLSAFHLQIHTEQRGDIPLECAFQGSKVFEHGGPNFDLYSAEPRAAKRDPRIRTSGRVVGFVFDGFDFPTEPQTAFYDWLYATAIFEHRAWLRPRLAHYAAFTDIEFNPRRSVNCQARSCALFVSLLASDLLEKAIESPTAFIEITDRPSHSHARGAAIA